jgi:hypothetical protein
LKKIGTYLLMGTAFISCPCHLIVSLPFVLGLLGGTALGTALAAHTGLVVAAVTAYFFVALIGGSYLLGRLLKDTENGPGSAPLSGRGRKTRASRHRAALGMRRPRARELSASRRR